MQRYLCTVNNSQHVTMVSCSSFLGSSLSILEMRAIVRVLGVASIILITAVLIGLSHTLRELFMTSPSVPILGYPFHSISLKLFIATGSRAGSGAKLNINSIQRVAYAGREHRRAAYSISFIIFRSLFTYRLLWPSLPIVSAPPFTVIAGIVLFLLSFFVVAMTSYADGGDTATEVVDDEEQSFQEIDKLQELGVNATDIKRLKEAGICTVEALFMTTRKRLMEVNTTYTA